MLLVEVRDDQVQPVDDGQGAGGEAGVRTGERETLLRGRERVLALRLLGLALQLGRLLRRDDRDRVREFDRLDEERTPGRGEEARAERVERHHEACGDQRCREDLY